MNISHVFWRTVGNNIATTISKLFSKSNQSKPQPTDLRMREPYTVIIGDKEGLDTEDIRQLKQWLKEARKEKLL